MLDPNVALGVLPLGPGTTPSNGLAVVNQDLDRAKQLGREVHLESAGDGSGAATVKLAQEGHFDLIIVALSSEANHGPSTLMDERIQYILKHAHCRVFLAAAPAIPQEVVDTSPSTR